MKESELRTEVGEEFYAQYPKGHLSWVETPATAAGFPDVDCCADGLIAQIELKVIKDGGKIEIRPTQYRWMKDRVRAGGNPVMIIGHDDGYYVLPGESVGKPSALTNMSQIKGRQHFSVQSIGAAVSAAMFIAKCGGIVCPNC